MRFRPKFASNQDMEGKEGTDDDDEEERVPYG